MDLWLSASSSSTAIRAVLRADSTNKCSNSLEVISMANQRPEGMVASAIEFGEICRKHDFHNFIFSRLDQTLTVCVFVPKCPLAEA